jgi:signal transduction histidine kinase
MGSTPAYLAGLDPLAFARGTASLTLVTVAVIYYLIWAGIIHFAMAFPRPHPWIERRPWITVTPYMIVYCGLAGSVALAVALDPGGLAFIDLALGLLGNLVVVATMVVAGGFMVSAWRRSEGEERRMLRGLFLTALVAMVGAALLGFIPEIVVGHPLLPWSVLAMTGLPFVVALSLAVLRHRAFDIEVVIRRSLVYGGMTLVVLGIYVAAVTVLGVVLREDAEYAVALLATALAALAALPVRDVLQRAVDRALYGDRDEPVRAMRRLGDRLTWTLEPEAMPEVIVGTIADSLRLPYVALETGEAETAHIVAARGRPPAEAADMVAIPLVARSAPVGRLLLGNRAPSEPLSRADRRLLDDLARQVGPAVDNLALIDALRRSRERIIVAGEEERRRLRRDLHDGLGPALAAVGMRAEAAGRLLDEDPDRARSMLAEVQAGVRAAVVDVRRLVEGLRPPALDELGLVGAIRQQAERLGVEAPTFVIDSPAPLGELPAAVEVAAYRIAVEAMTNVVRHARAAGCRIRVMTDGDGVTRRLRLEVVDDGSGLPSEPAAGVGLASMRERASEVGGEVRIEDVASGGTRVQAWLPLGSP